MKELQNMKKKDIEKSQGKIYLDLLLETTPEKSCEIYFVAKREKVTFFYLENYSNF